jgi:hypothetical protein
MKLKTGTGVAKVLWLLVVASSVSIAKAQENLRFPVVPGVSVGRVKLGDTQAVVRQKMGKPSESWKRKDGLTQDSWLGPAPKAWSSEQQRSFSVLYKNGKARQIEFNAPYFVTSQNISTQSTLRQFRAKHRRPRTRAYLYRYEGGGGHNEYYYDDRRKGICFHLGTQDYFNEQVRPESLRVHPRNVPVIIAPGGIATKADSEKPVGWKY